jgi:hypothetical protein
LDPPAITRPSPTDLWAGAKRAVYDVAATVAFQPDALVAGWGAEAPSQGLVFGV